MSIEAILRAANTDIEQNQSFASSNIKTLVLRILGLRFAVSLF